MIHNLEYAKKFYNKKFYAKKFIDRLVASKIAWVLVVALVVVSAIWAGYSAIWAGYHDPRTGFGSYINPKGEFQRYKTLWDWLQLLIVPGGLALFGWWFTRSRDRLAREIEESRKREERLQTYFDRMTELMLDKGLRSSKPGDEVRHIARVRTLTVLRGLDGKGKAALLRFLWEADLITWAIDNDNKPIIKLHEADLSGADLSKAVLIGADLSNANLIVADLIGADLSKAKLIVADLSKARLGGADLSNARLSWARLGFANLSKAKLGGANLSKAKLSEADLSEAKLIEADLSEANLSEAKLDRADLYYANLSEANLSGARLNGAYLMNANLSGANLSGARLNGANLSGADLSGANLTEAVGLTQAQIDVAKGDKKTELPRGIAPPKHWGQAPTT